MRTYAQVYKAIIGSANGLFSVCCLAIIWTNADLLLKDVHPGTIAARSIGLDTINNQLQENNELSLPDWITIQVDLR